VTEARREPVIDVELLVEELKARLARERAAGAYSDDLSAVALQTPTDAEEVSTAIPGYDSDAPRVRFRPELGFSSKPVIGPIITLVKQFLLRLLFFVFDDLAKQTDAALGRVEVALAVQAGDLQREAQRLDAEASRLVAATDLFDARVTAEAGAREAVQGDVKSLAERLAELHGRLERLQLETRLARLERDRRVASAGGSARVEGTRVPETAAPTFDYERFEDRFRPETSVRERQGDYVELLRAQKQVVDLGCGRGELIEMLREAGVSAYGVEVDPDFLALLEDKGIKAVSEDAVAHLEGLEPGEVDAIVASHLVEHLPAAAVSRLLTLAAEKLPARGILIVETPNPESLLAGSVNFHRDPTHIRPIHPETLSFLAESSGFSTVEIRRLSPVPEDERLPELEDGKVDQVIRQLNELLYGYQDYAVIARK
jgi:SAM-dependent methyltransferase